MILFRNNISFRKHCDTKRTPSWQCVIKPIHSNWFRTLLMTNECNLNRCTYSCVRDSVLSQYIPDQFIEKIQLNKFDSSLFYVFIDLSCYTITSLYNRYILFLFGIWIPRLNFCFSGRVGHIWFWSPAFIFSMINHPVVLDTWLLLKKKSTD